MSDTDSNPNAISLSGSLLLATPTLRDPNFARTVIYMAAHTADEGAFGYILNRPLDKRVADLLPDKDLGQLGEVPVYMGGPVSTDKLAFAALQWDKRRRALKCRTHLSVNDALHQMSMGREVRGFVGYSGWAGGQLENELGQHSWITCPPQGVVLNARRPEQLWSEILSSMGPFYRLMAGMPEDVTLN